jgi:biotin transporter BioY
LDVLFWFDHVKILWPLDLFGISTTTDFWGWIGITASERLLLFIGPTAEFLLYAVLYGFLWSRVKGKKTDRIKKFFLLMIILSIVIYLFLVVGVFFLPAKLITELSYGLGAGIWGVITIFTVIKNRKRIILANPE